MKKILVALLLAMAMLTSSTAAQLPARPASLAPQASVFLPPYFDPLHVYGTWYGYPEWFYKGYAVFGTGSITPAPTVRYAANVIFDDSGNNTSYGKATWRSQTAGGVTYDFTIQNPIAQTVSYGIMPPIGLPGGANYMLTNVGTISPIQLAWTPQPATGMTSWILAGSSGSQTVNDGETVTVAAGSGMLSTPVTATNTVTLNTVWSRSGTTLSPATAGDQVALSGTYSGAGGNLLSVTNASTSASTAAAIFIAGSAPGSTAYPSTYYGNVSQSAGGIGGLFLSDTNHAAFFDTADTLDRTAEHYDAWFGDANDAGGAARGRIKTGFIDLLESTAPDTAPTGCGRFYTNDIASTGNPRALMKDDGGYVHDLTVQHRQVYPVSHGATTAANNLLMDYKTGAMPLLTAPTFTITANSTVTLPTGVQTTGSYTESFGRFAWTSDATPTPDVRGQFMLGTVCRDFGGTVLFSVRLRVGTVNRISSVKLMLSEPNGPNSSVLSITPTTSFATYTSAVTNTTGWTTGPLFLSLWVQDSGVNFGAITVDVESFAIEQWVR